MQEPKIEKILRKNQNGFRKNRSTTSQILTICRILESVRAKSLEATILFVDLSKAFDSIHSGKMEQIFLAYGFLEETVTAIMMLYHHHHHHHHHHLALVARISLTLSRHSSLSFIALGRSSRQHPVSSHSCWMYVRAGRPAMCGGP